MELDLKLICSEISNSFTSNELNLVKVNYKNPGNGVTYEIDGNKCNSNISFWPNGKCDIDYILIENNKTTNNQFDFNSNEEAINTIIKEIKAAINRA